MTKDCKCIETFIAFDDKRFDDERECLVYEKERRAHNYALMKESVVNCCRLYSKACDALDEYDKRNGGE